MKRTKQQQTFVTTILSALKAGGGQHFCLRARAGTGKTSTLLEMVDDVRRELPQLEITLCAFNKAAADEIKEKLDKRGHGQAWFKVNAATVHSLGFSVMKRAMKNPGKGWVAKDKVRQIIAERNDPFYEEYGGIIERFVHFAKLEGFGFFGDVQIGDSRAWYKMADHYDINGFDDTSLMDKIVEAAQNIYRLSLSDPNRVDFDDMILFPLVKNMRVRFPKDVLVVDEAQDTGRARQALLMKFVKPRTGVMIVVGDDKQGIYAFAGAQANALDQLVEGLDMEVLPLTVSFRCPKAVIREAQKIVPDIEWAPNAEEGKVEHVEEMPELQPTDAILCRNTAPLVQQAYSLLRRGIACKVEGREIGEGLIALINRWKVKSIDTFLGKLATFKQREMQKAQAKNRPDRAQQIEDKCDTLKHLCSACLEQKKNTLEDVRKFIEDMFADNVKGVVTLCTYHRSKGREWDRVILFNPSLCPSPWAKQDWQKEQEKNLAYVATTRAKKELLYV